MYLWKLPAVSSYDSFPLKKDVSVTQVLRCDVNWGTQSALACRSVGTSAWIAKWLNGPPGAAAAAAAGAAGPFEAAVRCTWADVFKASETAPPGNGSFHFPACVRRVRWFLEMQLSHMSRSFTGRILALSTARS